MTAAPVEHALTTTVLQLPDSAGWRIVATCSCLGFGRKSVTPVSRDAAEFGRFIAADYHADHVLAVRCGRELPETRPAWLPPL